MTKDEMKTSMMNYRNWMTEMQADNFYRFSSLLIYLKLKTRSGREIVMEMY